MSSFLDLPLVRYSLAIIFFGAFLTFGSFAVKDVRERIALTQDMSHYYNAPGCYSGPAGSTPTDNSLPPCTYAAYKLVGKELIKQNHSVNLDPYLELKGQDGNLRLVGVLDKDKWTRVPIGADVNAQVWRGVIYKVQYQDGDTLISQGISDDQDNSSMAQNETLWVVLSVASVVIMVRLLTAREVLNFEM